MGVALLDRGKDSGDFGHRGQSSPVTGWRPVHDRPHGAVAASQPVRDRLESGRPSFRVNPEATT